MKIKRTSYLSIVREFIWIFYDWKYNVFSNYQLVQNIQYMNSFQIAFVQSKNFIIKINVKNISFYPLTIDRNPLLPHISKIFSNIDSSDKSLFTPKQKIYCVWKRYKIIMRFIRTVEENKYKKLKGLYSLPMQFLWRKKWIEKLSFFRDFKKKKLRMIPRTWHLLNYQINIWDSLSEYLWLAKS